MFEIELRMREGWSRATVMMVLSLTCATNLSQTCHILLCAGATWGEDLSKLAHGNWVRVLRETWGQ
jgi:microsomal dipeptidase-like Zn-dependent dipeptidase